MSTVIGETVAVTPAEPSDSSTPPAGMVRATGVIALGNVASRVLGLVREMLLTALFGPGAAVDAFNLAIIVPRGLYDLLIGGHVNSALVPVLSAYAAHENRRDLWELVNRLLGVVVVTLAALVLALEVFAPQVIGLIADRDAAPEVIALATDLLRITAPALIFLSLFAVLSGLLYALRRFTWPAFASTVFNGTIVLVTLALYRPLGITAVALGWLIGALVQMLLQAPGLRDARLRFQVRGALGHPGLRRIGVLYVPVMATLALDVLVNRPFSYNLASSTGEGSISYMSWATTLIQFPQGLVAIAISAAILPTLSRQAAAAQRALLPFKVTLGQGLRLALVLIIPATVGLFVLAEPTVALLFERGKFGATDTALTALALRLYLLGLPFAAVDLLLVYAFYAQQNTLVPALVGVISLAAYMAIAIGLLPWYSFFALMIADSVKHVVHSGVSAWLLHRRLGGYGDQRLIRTATRAALAAAGMGVLTYAAAAGLGEVLPRNALGHLIVVAGAGGVGLAVYSALASWLGLDEWRWMRGLLRERLARRAAR
ncbi:MAG TPA: murein biosynthesis integral membrane protein MurJ [Aggregatilineaceae bacterium]|nr:murein biosynthesis integral membrane protein MurJ [Aggregatilineaceae bacterium]